MKSEQVLWHQKDEERPRKSRAGMRTWKGKRMLSKPEKEWALEGSNRETEQYGGGVKHR